MKSKTVITYVAILAMTLTAGISNAEGPGNLDELASQMAAKKAEITSYSMDTEINMNMMGMSMSMTGSTQGKGDMMAATQNMAQMGVNTRMVLGADNIVWSEADMMGQKQITKLDLAAAGDQADALMGSMGGGMGSGVGNHPMDALGTNSELFSLRMGEPSEIDGEAVYTVEGDVDAAAMSALASSSPMVGQALGGASEIRIYIRQSDLFLIETQMLDGTGAALLTTKNSNIQVNPELDDSVFEYTPPEGATVMDLAAMMGLAPGAAPTE